MCGNEREDLQHLILHFPAYQEERRRHHGLQRPYQEEEDQVIARILFENENINIENTKEAITRFWHKREKKRTSTVRKTQTQTQTTVVYNKQHQGVPNCRYQGHTPDILLN